MSILWVNACFRKHFPRKFSNCLASKPGSFCFFPLGAIFISYRVECIVFPRRVRVPLSWELAAYTGLFWFFVIVWIVRIGIRRYA